MVQLLQGKEIAEKIIAELQRRIKKSGVKLHIAIIVCGNNPESLLYTKIKQKRSTEIGIQAELFHFPEEVTEAEVLETIVKLNNTVDGIIVQLPLPAPLRPVIILNAIEPSKDIDGLTDYTLGKVLAGDETLVPATPAGVLELLKQYNIELLGKKITIINHSTLIGKPLAMLFLNRGATVTICHKYTANLIEHTKNADIIISAVGIPGFIQEHMIAAGAILIDIGITKTATGVVGDVDVESVKEKASFLTPVPGGIGPMTVAMLLSNVVNIRTKHL